MGGRFVFVVAPNKHTVYPEQLPAGLGRSDTSTRLDQLAAALHERGEPFVDLRPVLMELKQSRRAYQRLGTHCNDVGAHAAYLAIGRRLGLPNLWTGEKFVLEHVRSGGDLGGMLAYDRAAI